MKAALSMLVLACAVSLSGAASAETIDCKATEVDSDHVIARASGHSAVSCTLELGKEVKESSWCGTRKGQRFTLLNHSNKTIMGKTIQPSKLYVTCPK